MSTPAIHLRTGMTQAACGPLRRARKGEPLTGGGLKPSTDTASQVTCARCRRTRAYQRRSGEAGILRERVVVGTEGRR